MGQRRKEGMLRPGDNPLEKGQRGFHHIGRIWLRSAACLRAMHRQARTVKDLEGGYQKGLGG